MENEKIIALETTLAHHERQIHDLSEMIGAQWREIEGLRRRLDDALAKIAETGDEPAATAKPPHY